MNVDMTFSRIYNIVGLFDCFEGREIKLHQVYVVFCALYNTYSTLNIHIYVTLIVQETQEGLT